MENQYCQVDAEIPFIDLSKYQQKKLIASSNNRVYLYCYQGQNIAVKEIVLPICMCKLLYREHEKQMIQRLKQIYLVQKGSNEFIIQIYGMAQLQQQRLSGKIQITIFICMEYMKYCLQDHIEFLRQNNIISTTQTLIYLLVQGIQTHYLLQQQHICHGDIKPQNILINDLQNPTIFKTCDFDNMIFVNHSRLQPCIISTQLYHSPEIQYAISKGLDTFHYNPYKAQMYSFGLCLIQLHPYNNINNINNETFINLKESFGYLISSLIQKTLDPQNFQRPDFTEMVSILAANGFLKQPNSSIIQQDILRSQNSYQVRNTPDMYDLMRRESKYPNQLQISAETTSDFVVSVNKSIVDDSQNQDYYQQLNANENKNLENKKCCTPQMLKTISLTFIVITLILSIFIVYICFNF